VFYYKVSLLKSPLGFLTYSSSIKLQNLTLINVNLRNKEVMAIVISEVSKPDFKTSEIITKTDYCFSINQYNLAKFISDYYFCSLGDALSIFTPFNKTIMIESKEIEIEQEITLSKQQQEALSFLSLNKTALLFGDTGSGKSEIYMKYFEDILKSGKRALFLMPEISLTPQMFERLKKHFCNYHDKENKDCNSVVMWHSKLTKVQKRKTLEAILSGEAKIIAGARSSLFLPINDLGIIVVDEEHDESYKASNRPRYHARDMAIYYGKLLNIPVVLGSATPSLTSYVKFPSFRLKGGFYNSKREFIFEPSTEAITPLLLEEIKNIEIKKEQAIVFIPTRAHFKYLICADCGFTYECPYCSVGMSLHHYAKALKCHYCNYSEKIASQCPKCFKNNLTSNRLGTAQAVDIFKEEFQNLTFSQFDRDTITTQSKLVKALKAFNTHEIDVLVGTHMLSKGHDYHDVTLALILGIDNVLQQSDYRAREKALSLLIQISGRSGRKKSARVVIQSFNKDFFLEYINEYEKFLDIEKVFREGLYPPYKKLCRLLFAHKNKEKSEVAMLQTLECLKLNIDYHDIKVEIVGSGSSAIEKIASKWRFQILLRSEKSTELIKLIKVCKDSSREKLCEVDMDPIEFA
jgi:primosomal protein N' (replication factor Y) (superfamily II helicase)